jgi:hypothetical protein
MNVKQFVIGIVLAVILFLAIIFTPFISVIVSGLIDAIFNTDTKTLMCCTNLIIYPVYIIVGLLVIVMIIGSFFHGGGGGAIQQVQIVDGRILDRKQGLR